MHWLVLLVFMASILLRLDSLLDLAQVSISCSQTHFVTKISCNALQLQEKENGMNCITNNQANPSSFAHHHILNADQISMHKNIVSALLCIILSFQK